MCWSQTIRFRLMLVVPIKCLMFVFFNFEFDRKLLHIKIAHRREKKTTIWASGGYIRNTQEHV